MKKLQDYKLVFLAIIFPVIIISCNDGKVDESKKMAETINDKKLRSESAERDAQFMVDATSICYDHTRMADIALTNGTGETIKKLAKNLKEINTKLIEQCNQVAGRKAITLPTEGTEKTLKDAGLMVDQAGNDFNAQWFDKTRALHAKQQQTFSAASGSATDSIIREWFKKNAPLIQKQIAALDSVAAIAL